MENIGPTVKWSSKLKKSSKVRQRFWPWEDAAAHQAGHNSSDLEREKVGSLDEIFKSNSSDAKSEKGKDEWSQKGQARSFGTLRPILCWWVQFSDFEWMSLPFSITSDFFFSGQILWYCFFPLQRLATIASVENSDIGVNLDLPDPFPLGHVGTLGKRKRKITT